MSNETMGILLLSGGLCGLLELGILYLFSSVKIKIIFVNNSAVALVYRKSFFLPFTTKTLKYKNVKEFFIKKQTYRGKRGSGVVYNLMIELLNGKKKYLITNEADSELPKLEQIRDQLNTALKNFQETEVFKEGYLEGFCDWLKKSSIYEKIFYFFIIVGLFAFSHTNHKYSRRDEIIKLARDNKESEQSLIEYIPQMLIVFFGMFFICSVMSLIVNAVMKFYENRQNKNKVFDLNKQEDVNLSSQSDKINDSIIK